MVQSLHEQRMARAYASLEGLSVGDAFGERYFLSPDVASSIIEQRVLPGDEPWLYTDDTAMALSIVAVLREHTEIDADALAASFATEYQRDPYRGYGSGMHRLLPRISQGASWRAAALDLFAGQGLYGNGAAMRVAPLGAYFADDLSAVVEHAARSAEVTHAHPEGIAGAVTVAVAVAWAWRLQGVTPLPNRQEFIDLILPFLPDGETRSITRRARDLSLTAPVQTAVGVLGSGYKISAQDTVPFVLWCVGQHLDNYEEAIWLAASGLGDVDTTCAMVGGIVASHTGVAGIPGAWRAAREPLPAWPFE